MYSAVTRCEEAWHYPIVSNSGELPDKLNGRSRRSDLYEVLQTFYFHCPDFGSRCTNKNGSHTEDLGLEEREASSYPFQEVSARFNEEDAATAFHTFNEYYYDEDAKLYYSSTEHTGLGSIWTQAIFWDIVMHYYEHTEEPQYLEMIHDIYQGGYDQYDGYNWQNEIEWFIYDDIMWWVISLARAYEITGEEVYLEKSITGFDRVWEGSYDPEQGGMYWDFHHSGKNACINYPTVIAAMRLFNLTGEESYLEKAREIYHWSRENLLDPESGRVADHISAGGNIGYEDYTYNQGTAIGAAVMLYQESGDERSEERRVGKKSR